MTMNVKYGTIQAKPNMVVDALSRKEYLDQKVKTLTMPIHSHLSSQIRDAQLEALKPENVTNEGFHGMDKSLTIREDGTYYFIKWIWTPKFCGLKDVVMNEAQKTRYFVHPDSIKMYLNIKQHSCWLNMKAEITTYMSKCLTCAMVKVEYQKPS